MLGVSPEETPTIQSETVKAMFNMVLGLEHEMEGSKSSSTQTSMGYLLLNVV